MKNSPNHTRLGSYISRSAVAGETYHAYVPTALPPVPALDMDSLYKSLDQAMRALGEVDALAKLLPDISMFLYMYVRKEALISSQIEGHCQICCYLKMTKNQVFLSMMWKKFPITLQRLIMVLLAAKKTFRFRCV